VALKIIVFLEVGKLIDKCLKSHTFWDFSYETVYETVLDPLIDEIGRYKKMCHKRAFLKQQMLGKHLMVGSWNFCRF
jgi:hypothetical protein